MRDLQRPGRYSGSGGPGHGGGIKGTGNFTWPVPGFYEISSPYGWRWNNSEFHKGIDIAGGGIYGAEIVAADAGTVAFSDDQEVHGAYGGYGNVVVIDHGNGTMTLYGHMSRRAVSTGDNVSKGEVIGYVGAAASKSITREKTTSARFWATSSTTTAKTV